MLNESDKSYPERATLIEEELDPNSSYSKMLELAGTKGRVLDVGCAAGYLGRLLTERGCRVTGIDINPKSVELAQKYCERALVADLDIVSLTETFPGESFDVIIFGDVLEHLRNPWNVLDDARRLLAYKGHAVASIPNIAHGAIRLALLKGRFDYSEFGILDNTHLRFFTKRTIEELFVQSGYEIERVEKTILPLFAPTNLVPELDRADFDASVISDVERDEDVETLQFVVKAKALDDGAKLGQITQRYLLANAQNEAFALHELAMKEAAVAVEESEQRSAASRSALDAAEQEAIRLHSLLEEAKTKAELSNAAIEQLDETIGQLREERAHFRQLQQREAELQLALADISLSVEASTRELKGRLARSSNELRHQRQAYDEVCNHVSAMRRVLARAEQQRTQVTDDSLLTYNLVLARSNELSMIVSELANRPAATDALPGKPLSAVQRLKWWYLHAGRALNLVLNKR